MTCFAVLQNELHQDLPNSTRTSQTSPQASPRSSRAFPVPSELPPVPPNTVRTLPVPPELSQWANTFRALPSTFRDPPSKLLLYLPSFPSTLIPSSPSTSRAPPSTDQASPRMFCDVLQDFAMFCKFFGCFANGCDVLHMYCKCFAVFCHVLQCFGCFEGPPIPTLEKKNKLPT